MGATLSQPASDKHTESGQDDRYHYAVSEMQGWRISMEDAHATVLILDEEAGDKNSFFAVYDGHGGGTTAKFAGQNVHKRLLKEEAYAAKNYEEALKRAFLGTDEDLLADPAHAKDPSGCTAVAALVTENKIYVANAGDSRSVISVKGEVEPLSFDHKPTNDVEKARITAAGGYIEYGRVNGNLALSRAIGDFEFKKNYTVTPEKQVITADPDLTAHDLTTEDEFLVIACDGIWDCLTSQQVVDFVRREVAQGKELTEICENMCEHCLAPDTSSGAGIGCDNMTVMIIALLHGRTKEEWAAWVKKRFDDKYGYATPETHPQLYSATRMAAFKARRVDWERRRAGGNTEASPTDGVLDLSRLQGLAQVLGSNGGISFRPGGQILSDTGALMFGGDDDDSDESDTEMSGPGIHSQAITIGRDSPDEQSLNSLKDRLDAFEREEEEEAKRLSGDTPAAEHALPNGDSSKPIPPVEQSKPLPGGDSVSPVVAVEEKAQVPSKAV